MANPNNFFDLSKSTQKTILSGAESRLSLPALILEKDIWICWVLQELFSLPVKMSFKGGTSLSKGYHLIQRFSEDVDITLDYRNFFPSTDLNQPITSNALKKLSDELKKCTKDYVINTLCPHINQSISKQFPNENFEIKLSDNAEEFRVFYPTLFKTRENYLQNHVLIEFGGRNSTEPNESKLITTFLSQVTPELNLPTAQVNVLLPTRTFWEKATLIHVECHRGRLKESPHRLFRHWYDLAVLTQSWVGKAALADRELLQDVILHKKSFYKATYTHYDDCLNGKFLLIPSQIELRELKKDFIKMEKSGMFSEKPTPFHNIVETLKALECEINQNPI